MFEFTVDMTALAGLVLVAGAIVIGLIAQVIGDVRASYHWGIVAVFALIGGLAASEFIVDWQAFKPVWEGLALVPALIGGVVLGVIADVVVRLGMGGSYRGTTEA